MNSTPSTAPAFNVRDARLSADWESVHTDVQRLLAGEMNPERKQEWQNRFRNEEIDVALDNHHCEFRSDRRDGVVWRGLRQLLAVTGAWILGVIFLYAVFLLAEGFGVDVSGLFGIALSIYPPVIVLLLLYPIALLFLAIRFLFFFPARQTLVVDGQTLEVRQQPVLPVRSLVHRIHDIKRLRIRHRRSLFPFKADHAHGLLIDYYPAKRVSVMKAVRRPRRVEALPFVHDVRLVLFVKQVLVESRAGVHIPQIVEGETD